MSYAANLSNEGIDNQFLLVIKPRRRAETWTSLGSNKYKTSFAFGQVVAVTINGTSCTEVGSSAALVSNNQFYYDVDASELYVRTAVSPIAEAEIIATYELYFGTFDAHWYRDPIDDTTREVYFEPLIMRTPNVVSNLSDSLFGYMPSSSTQIVISNVTKFLQEHLYASSFKNAGLRLFHQLGELTVDNLKELFKGLIDSVDSTDNEVTFRVLDMNNIFDVEYRNPDVDNNFFGDVLFPDVEPNSRNRPIRTVYGIVDGVIGINYDYSETESATTNRYHVLMAGSSGFPALSKTVPASPSSTTTRTYLNSVTGLRVGDDVFLDSASGPSFDARIVITTIGANYIEHAAIGTLAATGSVVTRSWLGAVRVIKNGVSYRLTQDEYSVNIDGTKDIAAVTINQATLFSNRSFYVAANDTVYCRVYGKTNNVTLDATPLGSDSTETGNLTGIVPVLVDILKGAVGLSESEIDVAQFQSLTLTVDDEVGFTLPFQTGSNFPSCRDIVSQIAQTALLRVFVNDAGEWSANQFGPIGSVTKTIEDDEILEPPSVKYSIDYSDVLSDVLVDYGRSEINSRNQLATDSAYTTVRSNSTLATRLHYVTKQKTFQSLHFLEAQAQRLADRLLFTFSDRRGIATLTSKTRFFDTEIGDVIKVQRTQIPGFAFDSDTLRSRNLSVQGTNKTISEIELTLDDQKGVEDNAGDW